VEHKETASNKDKKIDTRSYVEALVKASSIPSRKILDHHPCFTPYTSPATTSSQEVIVKRRGRGRRRCVALDCEMVGVGPMKVSVLARVSIVNMRGDCIFDAYVKVEEAVTDYRTEFSGIRPHDLQSEKALSFGQVRSTVEKILSRCVVVGHGLENDLAVLHLHKSAVKIRDTSQYIPFMKQWNDGTYRPRRLRDLVWEKFGIVIQSAEHSSIEDAQAVMALYKLVRNEWEALYAPHTSGQFARTINDM
jgi:RNA exonuclease 4